MNLEPMIKVHMNKYAQNLGIQEKNEDEIFEYYINYLIFSVQQPNVLSVKTELQDLINVGGYNDLGLDGIGIKVNDNFIANEEDIDIIIKDKNIKIEFVFIQTKNKNSFKANEFLVFSNGIMNFLEGDVRALSNVNDKVKHWLKIKEKLCEDDIMLHWDGKIIVRVYYCALSENKEIDINLENNKSVLEKRIESLGTYQLSNITLVDSQQIYNFKDDISNNFEVVLNTSDNIGLPEVVNVTNSAIISTDSNELMKMLQLDDGQLRKSLFEDNVRAYQGNTDINKEILSSIKNYPERFMLLNNGITVVCDEFKTFNKKIVIKKPQIVNGCQTCNVIYNYHKNNNSAIGVPIFFKIIASNNSEIINQIVRSTNRQNIVLDEVFEITRDFHKKFEEYVLAKNYDKKQKIYYERRSKQYLENYSIKFYEKFNLKILTQASVSILLDLPEIGHRHESILIDQNRDKIFVDGHAFIAYYTSVLLNYKLEECFANKKINKKAYYKYKNQILCSLKYLMGNIDRNLFDEKTIEKQCNAIINKIEKEFFKYVETAISILNNCISIWKNVKRKSEDVIKDSTQFRELLILELIKFTKSPNNNIKPVCICGTITNVKKDKYNRLIAYIRSNKQTYLYFQEDNNNINLYNLYHKFVLFDIAKSNNGTDIAINLKEFKIN